MHKQIKDNRGVAEWIVVLLVGIFFMAVASAIILRTRNAYKESDELYDEVRDEYVKPAPTLDELFGGDYEGSKDKMSLDDLSRYEWTPDVDIELNELIEKHPDVVGWIYFENEDISYPILFSGDNVTYLRRSYDGKNSSAGSIFLDGRSATDFSNPHTVIYGHNMRNLSMFGKLRYYRTNPDYYNEHRYFQIFTKDYVYRYLIYAYEEISVDDNFYEITGASASEYEALLARLKNNSLNDTGVDVNISDNTVTLATCTTSDEKRMLVCAVRVDTFIR